jgi:Tol biopolymer transport system component
LIGSALGHYQVTASLGAGGMGEVYRATDSRLKREVAIKVLPEAFTTDRERLARFEREAQLLAQLHHPNIAAIHGLEESGGRRALVMELVEGEDLSARIARGPLPLDEALATARQIAEALEAAHEQGIVHRDLKPANVKVRPDGTVKVLDFGLAKAMDAASAASAGDPGRSPTLANSPTLTAAHGTQLGLILGTAAYMAPEQAAGGAVDRRADIWSFGVVLYEMLAGRRLFEGETVSHVLAGVLKDEPDFSTLPAATPGRIVDLVRRCLRKKPRERLQAIGDARVVIEEALAHPERERPSGSPSAAGASRARAGRLAWLAAAAGLVAAGVFAALWLAGAGGDGGGRRLHATLLAPAGAAFGDSFALSPDARRLVFEAYDAASGRTALWLRELETGESRRLAGTEGGELPFWSPDGKQIGFFAQGKLRRLDPAGGAQQVVCDAPTPRGAAWGEDGRIVLSASFRTGLSIVPATGGTPRPLTTLDAARKEKSHRFPVFLPGGERLLFVAQTAEGGSRDDASAIEALELATGKRTRLVAANSSPLYAPSGHLLFWRDGSLFAQRFDARRLAVAGEPVAIAAGVAYNQNEQALAAVSGEGTLVYQTGSRGSLGSLVWVDRRGIDTAPIRERELFADFALSHDGSMLAYSFTGEGQGSTNIWVHDLERGSARRLTFEEGSEFNAAWSPDDRAIYYANDARNDGAIFRRAVDGTGAVEEVGTTEQGIWPMQVAPDGSWLAVGKVGAGSSDDIFRFELASKRLTPLVTTPFLDQMGRLSPDGRLLAYASEESGRWEIYVQALGAGGGRWQVSSQGGYQPRWRGDGRELFFGSDPDRMMAVAVEPGEVPSFATPVELFRRVLGGYDVTPDGERFVGLVLASGGDAPLTLVTDWTRALPE